MVIFANIKGRVMKFTKEVQIEPMGRRFSRRNQILLWGSCFAEELRAHLHSELYRVEGSPFGIMYNPLSIASGLRRVLEKSQIEESELYCHRGEWHSASHHGSYSHAEKEVALAQMQSDFARTEALVHGGEVSLFVFTFGTAFVYEMAEEPRGVVNNCHRLPAERFTRRRLTLEEIVEVWLALLEDLQQKCPRAEVLFTVSPICHYRDGAHESRLSKSILLLAIDEITRRCTSAHYFPAYEIQIDELRDYRFYKEDFAHPTPQAVQYILSRFAEHYLEDRGDVATTAKWHRLKGKLTHRPLTTNLQILRQYYEALYRDLQDFARGIEHPYLTSELSRIEQLLSNLCQNTNSHS